jgi:PIN domain nuclease of toxin-antitoxin system
LKLLLDTHAALWFLSDDQRLGESAARQLTDDTNQVLLSAVVVWEVAIKRSLGKLEAPENFAPTLLDAGLQPLPISIDHVAAVEQLPGHHRDPFDRMLVAQASIEGAALVSHDEALRPYGVTLVW